MTLIFVCDGNTCRSPIAAAAARRTAPVAWTVRSAGLRAEPGAPASANAVKAGAALGLDLTDHRARPLRSCGRRASLIVVMEDRHVDGARAVIPQVPIVRLAERDIDDPWGQGEDVYEATARAIVDAVDRLLDERTPL